MRLIKSNIPTDRKNSFFIKVLSGILVFCLLLVSFVFLLIYQNVKKRSLEQSYLAEQDIVSNVSYSASIMQDTASSMLTQLNGDPKLLQLIYSMDTESLSVIQSMQLLQNYTRASSWLDSVYIYCAEEDCICYAYANGNTYQLSFGTLDDFFDAAFVRNLAAVSRVTQSRQCANFATAARPPTKPFSVMFCRSEPRSIATMASLLRISAPSG